MPDYFVFWDAIVGRIRIHRADCGACKYASDIHEGRIKGRDTSSSFGWEPAETYAKAFEMAASLKRRKAFERSIQTDCDQCHPERSK
jgi:hypothetical protein